MMEHHNEKVINWKMLQEAYNNLNTHVRRAVTATVRTAINLDYHLPLSLVIGWNREKKDLVYLPSQFNWWTTSRKLHAFPHVTWLISKNFILFYSNQVCCHCTYSIQLYWFNGNVAICKSNVLTLLLLYLNPVCLLLFFPHKQIIMAVGKTN